MYNRSSRRDDDCTAPFGPAGRLPEEAAPAAPERVIQWYRKSASHDPNYVRVWIDVRKLDAMLPLASTMIYVGFAGENGIMGKYSGVDEFVRKGEEKVYMPEVKIEPADKKHPNQKIVYISNGRHRFAWMRDHGARAIPVAALISEAGEVARLVGTKDRICRVKMHKIIEWYYMVP